MRDDSRPTFAEFDKDGALLEMYSQAPGLTRAAFFKRAAAVVGVAAAASALPASTAFAKNGVSDTDILNYALTLEYLEAAFYAKAVSSGALSGETANFAKVVAAHEQAHVDALKKALGSKAVKKPSFDFKGTTDAMGTFQATSKVLEDTGVAAYQGQVLNIGSAAVLGAAGSIMPVEARHAAWIASIISKGGDSSPAPAAFSEAKDMATILAAVKGTGFLGGSGGSSAAPASAVSGTPNVAG